MISIWGNATTNPTAAERRSTEPIDTGFRDRDPGTARRAARHHGMHNPRNPLEQQGTAHSPFGQTPVPRRRGERRLKSRLRGRIDGGIGKFSDFLALGTDVRASNRKWPRELAVLN
jgi:hypothetical protein